MSRSAFARLLTAAVFGVLAPGVAPAGFNIGVSSTTIAPDGTATVNVTLQSSGPPIQLSSFGFEILITGGGVPLQFATTQSDAQFANPSYVFFNNSLAQSVPSPLGTVTMTNQLNDTFIGSDGAEFGPTPAVGAEQLLATLDVNFGPATAISGSVYTVTVQSSANTFFFDGDFNEVMIDNYGSGTVTVTGATVATPAPPTVLLPLCGLVVAGIGRWRGRSRVSPGA